MPFTSSQRKLFHAAEGSKKIAREHGLSHREAGRLAHEADDLAREGHERRAVTKKAIDVALELLDRV